MKKTNQTDLDFDMINLDETAGWNRLELESALQEAKEETKEESLVFQGEVTISEDELFAEEMVDTYEAEVEYFDEEDDFEDYEEDEEDESDDDEDFEEGFDFGDEETTIYEVECACGEIIDFDEEVLEKGSMICPNCGETLEFSTEDDE